MNEKIEGLARRSGDTDEMAHVQTQHPVLPTVLPSKS